MKTKNVKLILLFLTTCLLLSACASTSADAADPDRTEAGVANLANPAAVFCQERGHTYEIRRDATGNEYGICVFLDGSECEAWTFYRGECEPGGNPTDYQLTETALPALTEEAHPSEITYQDDEYRLAVTYPADWTFVASAIGQDSETHPLSKMLEFRRDNWLLTVHYKLIGDITVISGGIGAGDIVENGHITLFGQMIPVFKLVHGNQTIMLWVGMQLSDLEVYAKLEDTSHHDFDEIDIPPEIWEEAVSILSTLVRTGEPFPVIMETPRLTTAPQATQALDICTLPVHLMVGIQAEVTPGLPNALRSAPSRGTDNLVIGEIKAGTIVDVLDGPVCADGFNWWKVDTGEQIGWTAEGQGLTYWLVPYTTIDGAAVDGWVGVLISTPDWFQVDDYFQVLDQNGSRYGIHALNPELKQALESYRDTGVMIRVWGTLYRNRMDAYNTQIEVSRFEEFEE